MRTRVATLGVVLIIVALFFYLNPGFTGPLTTSTGLVSENTVFDRTSIITVPPQNFSYYETSLEPGDTLTVTLTTNPGNVDVLLMNQGNFSLWSKSSSGAYSTYPQSVLHVSNYSFSFLPSEPTQDYFVVVLSHTTAPTNVLVHAVDDRPSLASELLFPIVFGAVGVLILAVGLRGGGKKPVSEGAQEEGLETQPVKSPSALQAGKCRHCGAALKPDSQFCPSCNRSQL